MKKLSLVLGLAAAVCLAGCSTDPTQDLPITEGRGSHTIYATTGDNDTRTSLGEKNEETHTTPVLWSEGDAIAVIADGTTYKYILNKEDAGKASGSFTVTEGDGAKDAKSIIAYYPYDNYSKENQTMTIPAEQSYLAGRTYSTNLNPMYATSTDMENLRFHHMAGVINLQLKNIGAAERKIKSIELVSTDHPLHGTATIGEDYVLTFPTFDAGVNNNVTLKCATPVALNTDMTTPTCFMFVVPSNNYPARSLTFRITDSDDQVVTLTATKALELSRGGIINFAAAAVPNVKIAETPAEVSNAIDEALAGVGGETPSTEPIYVQVSGEVTADATVEIPTSFTSAEQKEIPVTIDIPSVTNTNATITIQAGTSGTATDVPAKINIVTDPTMASNLVLDLPNSTVTVNGKFTALTATTAENTLIVNKASEIETLTVNKGSVNIYGHVTTIVKESGAGTVTRYVSTQKGLDQALDTNDKADNYLLVTAAEELDAKGATITTPLSIGGSFVLKNLTVNATDANAIATNADNITFSLKNVKMSTTTANKANSRNGLFIGNSNVNATLIDCRIVSSGKDPRGISITSDVTKGDVTLTLDNTKISTAETWIGNVAYTEEQIAYFKSQIGGNGYPRGISIYGCKEGTATVNILNGSGVEGFAYAINCGTNSDNTAPRVINVKDSHLDGRCAFNLWPNSVVANVENSTLVGRNYFGGSTEDFATIVYNSANHSVTVKDSEVISYNAPQTATNHQYSVSLRSTGCTLRLLGSTKLIEKETPEFPARMSFLIDEDYEGQNTIEIAPSVTVEGMEGATPLPQLVWDGTSTTRPALGLVKDNSLEWPVYQIYQGSDLAWVAKEANAGRLPEGTGILLFRDIDLGGHNWTPIGYTGLSNPNDTEPNYIAKGHLFSGCAFGNNHVIRNAVIDVTTPARGIFGQVYGTAEKPAQIEDIAVENITIKGEGKWTGGLVGYVRNVSTISNCSIKDITIAMGDNGNSYGCGGLLGYISNNTALTIDGCSSENITFTGKGWNNGGLIGKFFGNKKVTIQNCEPAKGYIKTVFAKNQTLPIGVMLYYAPDGYNNSWFVGNITNQNGFDLTITNVTNNSAKWTEIDAATNANLNAEAKAGAYLWPYIGVYDAYNNAALTGTITIDGKKVHPMTYAVGDLYNQNGVKGIVYKLTDGDGKHGMIVSIDSYKGAWSDQDLAVGCTEKGAGTGAGLINCKKVWALPNLTTDYLGFQWVKEKNNNVLDSTIWYIPSSYELYDLYVAVCGTDGKKDKAIFNKYMIDNSLPVIENELWSSTESNGVPLNMAKSIDFTKFTQIGTDGFVGLSTGKNAAWIYFRAVHSF